MSSRGLQLLFRPVSAFSARPTVFQWWNTYVSESLSDMQGLSWLDKALYGGFCAEKLSYAFAAGYQTAQRDLGMTIGATDSDVVAFCVTERGNRPKDIKSTLTHAADGVSLTLNGEKSFVSLAPGCARLNVVATFVPRVPLVTHAGRGQLMVVSIPVGAPGVTLSPRPPLPFLCEIPHATAAFVNVDVPVESMYAGDGYDAFMKPFRTVEDLHVQAASLGHVVRLLQLAKQDLAVHYGNKPSASTYTVSGLLERLLAHAATLSSLVAAEKAQHTPAVHLAVAGALNSGFELLAHAFDVYCRVEVECGLRPRDAVAHWKRDYEKLSTVAASVRQARRESAWNRALLYDGFDQ